MAQETNSPTSIHIGSITWTLWVISTILARPYLPTCHWSLRSMPRSPRLLGWCLNWRRGCGPTTTWWTTLRCKFTEPVSSASCCIQARRGPPTLPRKGSWTDSTSAAFSASSASTGRNVFPTLKYFSGQGYPPSFPCWLSADCGGLAMCTVWMTSASPKTFSMANSPKVPDLKVVPPSATKTHASVTWEMWTSTSTHGKASRKTAEHGSLLFEAGFRGPRPTTWSSWCRKEPSQRKVLLARLPLGLCALPAPETATLALVYTATPESATL